jgi:uncharacterized BrkB/YihY/UPF0761 family membrane protein
MAEDAAARDRKTAVKDALARRYADLERRRHVSFVTSVLSRYRHIEGNGFAAVLSVTLFTTILPLIILGFGHLSGFADNISVGTMFERQLGLEGALAATVREAFGSASGLRSSWTILGLAGFLVWGIPMTMTVADVFGRAWLRKPQSAVRRMWRGTCWFVLYLVTLDLNDDIAFRSVHSLPVQVLLIVVTLVPTWLFWTVTPALLVPDGARGWRFLAKAGLAGAVIEGVLTVALRLVFPPMLAGWTGFGPIGVAMAIMTWCGVIGIGWVATACAGAVLWERSAPAQAVISAQADSPDGLQEQS